MCPEAKDMQITVDYLLLSPLVSLSPNGDCLRTAVSLMNKLEDYGIRRMHIFIYINVMEFLSPALRKIAEGNLLKVGLRFKSWFQLKINVLML